MIKPTRVFLNYSSIDLLSQYVNSLGLTIAKNKLAAIAAIKYPSTLGDFEYFLSLTEYLQLSVHCYTQIITPLQDLKTFLLKLAPIADGLRKTFASKTKLTMPTDAKLASFHTFKEKLSQAVMLVYFSADQML